jgi:4'-phosphopantetheinyl transferase
MAPDAHAMDLLDAREVARAGRFRSPLHQRRYVTRHAFLRRVLGAYLDTAPSAVAISVTPAGRPQLDPAARLDLSTSHDDGLAVVAIVRGTRVGIDVERVRPVDDAADLAATHLTRREVAWLGTWPADRRSWAFLTLWTRKEAVVKLLGTGLSTPLASFDTGIDDARAMSQPSGLTGPSLRIAPLDGVPSHVGSVAVEAASITVRMFTSQETTT